MALLFVKFLLKVFLTLCSFVFHDVIDIVRLHNKQEEFTRQQIFLVWLRLIWKLQRFTARMMHHIQTAQQCVVENELIGISETVNVCLPDSPSCLFLLGKNIIL